MREEEERPFKSQVLQMWSTRQFATTCPLKKKGKEDSDSKFATAKGDDGSDNGVAVNAHVP